MLIVDSVIQGLVRMGDPLQREHHVVDPLVLYSVYITPAQRLLIVVMQVRNDLHA
jgi:hypothetical protein